MTRCDATATGQRRDSDGTDRFEESRAWRGAAERVRADAVGVAARARVDAVNWVDAMESFAVKLASSASFVTTRRRGAAAMRTRADARVLGFFSGW